MSNTVTIIFDNAILKKYEEHYFELYPKRRKFPFTSPLHPSINTWVYMNTQARNNLKQHWKEYVVWVIEQYGLTNLGIEKCELSVRFYFKDKRRHDLDNQTLKMVLDGFTESGLIVDDDYLHIVKYTSQAFVDKQNPRMEIILESSDI